MDEEFINRATNAFGSRARASVVWWMLGDNAMAKGDPDDAMRMYNKSWLLNPNSFRAYWGFGRVLLEKDQLDESLGYLEKAIQLVDDQQQRGALLADLSTAYSAKANRTITDDLNEGAKHFLLANQHYEESAKLDPSYQHLWRSWARSLYFEGRYAEAWKKVKTARSLGTPELPPQFIKGLEEKMPQPQ